MKQADKIIEWAKAQLGTMEHGNNNVRYNTDFYGGEVQGNAFPWCCAFVWDGFRETGLSSLFCGGQRTAYCPFVMAYAKERGLWVTEYRQGDLLLYDWNGDGVADHIGICVDVIDPQNVKTIEGNVNNGVFELTRSKSSILGAYRPQYAEDIEIPTEIPTGEPKDDCASFYVVKQGDTLWGIATAHNMTVAELCELNDLDPREYIFVGQVLFLEGEKQADERYTVQVGDTLWSLAEKHFGSGWKWYKIASDNHIAFPYTIYPGQKLIIAEE